MRSSSTASRGAWSFCASPWRMAALSAPPGTFQRQASPPGMHTYALRQKSGCRSLLLPTSVLTLPLPGCFTDVYYSIDQNNWRRWCDSNARTGCPASRLSRPLPSTAWVQRHIKNRLPIIRQTVEYIHMLYFALSEHHKRIGADDPTDDAAEAK